MSFAVVVWARDGEIGVWLPTVSRLLGVPGVDRIAVRSDDRTAQSALPKDDRLSIVNVGGLDEVLLTMAQETADPVLVVTSPVLLPEMGIDPALRILAEDARVASVSFFSNAAAHLSFPVRNRTTPYAYGGHDETTMTRRLREIAPEILPAPLIAPAGAATLVSRDSIIVTGGPAPEFAGSPEVGMIEMALRASRRGFRSVLDPATYVSRLWESPTWDVDPFTRPEVRHRLHELHPWFLRQYTQMRRNRVSALGLAHRTARTKVVGLRILFDATCLGPIETGTQVQTLALIEALCRRDDVLWVGAGISGSVPRYAERVLADPKVEIVKTDGLKFPASVGRADVVHRPFQPTGQVPWPNWRRAASRVVVTLQDLIAYSIGAYHDTEGDWARYRRGINRAVSQADGLVVISHDVSDDLRRERLPVVDERSFVIENGTDHLTGDEPDEFPRELLARGWAARPFILVLGTNYNHKNRDLAIRVFRQLREKHPSLGLVLAGVSVAQGSSRILEAVEGAGAEGIVNLPDVTSEERNWLLRHAAVCLYPTSAEGFGLVPFESARFGTPTAHVRFGPLAEVLSGVPVVAESWDPAELADCCDRLISDPQLAADQVAATLKCGTRYTWDATAEQLVDAYRGLLAKPPR